MSNAVSSAESIPPGYWLDAAGRLIPESMIRPIDTARDELVRELIAQAKASASALLAFKERAMGEIAAFVEMSAGEWQVRLGGKKGNVTLFSYDGRYKIVRSISETLHFDEQLQAAKALIDECILAWSGGADPKIVVLVNDAFQVNKEGAVDTGRVLGLKRLDIRDETWKRAMDAISSSVRVNSSKSYVRFYERQGESEEYKPIELNLSAA